MKLYMLTLFVRAQTTERLQHLSVAINKNVDVMAAGEPFELLRIAEPICLDDVAEHDRINRETATVEAKHDSISNSAKNLFLDRWTIG